MEENKPKNSFFRKWAKRIALALGIGASTLSLGTSDAHAAGLVDDREDNNIKVETAVDNSTIADSHLKTDLDDLMAKDGKITFKGGSQILSDEKPVTSNEKFEVSDGVEQEPTEPIKFRINSIEYPELEKTAEQANETVENDTVEVAQDTTAVVSDIEARVKALVANSKFKNLKPQDFDMQYAHELVLLQQKISEAKEAGDVEKAEALAARFEKRLTKLTNFMNSDRSTPGQQIAENSDGIVRLELAINSFIQYNDPDKLDDAGKENYYTTLGRLMDAYNDAKQKNTVLAEQALENLGNPGYELEAPNYFDDYPNRYEEAGMTDTIAEVEETEPSNTTVEVEETKADDTTVEVADNDSGLIDDREAVAEDEPVDHAVENDYDFKDIYVAPDANIQNDTHSFKISTEEYTITPVQPGNIDESKLHNVSVGQMGDYEVEDEETQPETHSGKINFEKMAEGPNQMGEHEWDLVEEVVDEELEKMESQGKDKTVEVDDDMER